MAGAVSLDGTRVLLESLRAQQVKQPLNAALEQRFRDDTTVLFIIARCYA